MTSQPASSPLQKFIIELNDVAAKIANVSEFEKLFTPQEAAALFHRIKGAAGFLELEGIESHSKAILSELRSKIEDHQNSQPRYLGSLGAEIEGLIQEIIVLNNKFST